VIPFTEKKWLNYAQAFDIWFARQPSQKDPCAGAGGGLKKERDDSSDIRNFV